MYIGSSIIGAEDFGIWKIVYFGFAKTLVSFWVYPKSDINTFLSCTQEHCDAPLRFLCQTQQVCFPTYISI